MAVETLTIVRDDLDKSEGAETISFGLRGKNYEIDLGPKNAAALEKALEKYIAVARSSSAPRGRRAPARSGRGGRRADLGDIRSWAAANGHKVSGRGRIPASVVDAYDAANG